MLQASGTLEASARVRTIAYPEAESLALRLGRRLRARLGSDCERLPFRALPRGGLFVLGMIGYVLDLAPSQLRGQGPASDPRMVLIDDCALSGARLAQELDRLDAGRDAAAGPLRVVVAHLLSPPELRQAVEELEPRVEACVTAADLASHPEPESDGEEAFDVRWRPRLPGRRYWLGSVERVAFPWSEPETVWWNARDERLETGWHRASPRHCLRFRAELDLPEPDGTPGPLDLAEGALWKLDGDRLLLRRSEPSGRLVGLEGVALDMWRALIAFGDAERAREHLLGLYAVDGTELAEDLEAFLDDLCDRGFLVRGSAGE